MMVASGTATPPSWGARSGMSMSRTTTAKSWNSRTENVARPCFALDYPRSWRTWSATAVEDKARLAPTIMAAGPWRTPWVAMVTDTAIAVVVARTWVGPETIQDRQG